MNSIVNKPYFKVTKCGNYTELTLKEITLSQLKSLFKYCELAYGFTPKEFAGNPFDQIFDVYCPILDWYLPYLYYEEYKKAVEILFHSDE